MSRPILSRPRTRVYGCNYDKGESYYKPMVDHLDRKYSSRPLFSEPRTSLADEIAARRNDIGSRDLSGSRNDSFGRDLDLEFDPQTAGSRGSHLSSQSQPLSTDPFLLPEDEDTVYDSRGQRTQRRFADEFANDVAVTTRRFKARVAAMGLDEDADVLEGVVSAKKAVQSLTKAALEDMESGFKRRSKLFTDDAERGSNSTLLEQTKPSLVKWSKLLDEDKDRSSVSAAASRAKQTKARLSDLENEMEELAERQAKRERRAAALRALVNETAVDDRAIQQASVVSKKVSVRSVQSSDQRAEKHVNF